MVSETIEGSVERSVAWRVALIHQRQTAMAMARGACNNIARHRVENNEK